MENKHICPSFTVDFEELRKNYVSGISSLQKWVLTTLYDAAHEFSYPKLISTC
jgi:hypothetical protein